MGLLRLVETKGASKGGSQEANPQGSKEAKLRMKRLTPISPRWSSGQRTGLQTPGSRDRIPSWQVIRGKKGQETF